MLRVGAETRSAFAAADALLRNVYGAFATGARHAAAYALIPPRHPHHVIIFAFAVACHRCRRTPIIFATILRHAVCRRDTPFDFASPVIFHTPAFFALMPRLMLFFAMLPRCVAFRLHASDGYAYMLFSLLRLVYDATALSALAIC